MDDCDCFATDFDADEQPSKPKRQRRVKRGSLADRLARSHLKPGPASVEDLFNYPVELVAAVFQDAERGRRLRELLADGLIEHSDYSGVSAEREAKRLLIQVLAEDHHFKVSRYFIKACDIDEECQKVLVHTSDHLDEGRSCVFTDIREQIHPEAQAFCSDVIAKAKEAGTEAEFLSAHSDILHYLLQNSSWIVNQD